MGKTSNRLNPPKTSPSNSVNSTIIKDISELLHLDTSSLGGRIVGLLPLWDGEEWHLWMRSQEGFIRIKPIDAVEVDYLGRAPANESDIFIPFVDLMWQRASYPGIYPLIVAICEDFHNMGTSVAKLRHFFDTRELLRQRDASRFASTELEYIVILARTVFDLLQEMIACIWQKHVRLIDPEMERRRNSKKLPDTFSKMVMIEKTTLRTAEQIEQQFGLPSLLANEYSKHSRFFADLRNARDNIVHGGSGIGTIFDTERGFCVRPEDKPFSLFGQWEGEHYYNENLVSVLPWVAGLVQGTINACNSMVSALATTIQFPPALAPGLNVYVRGPSTRALNEVLQVYQGGSPWWQSSTHRTVS